MIFISCNVGYIPGVFNEFNPPEIVDFNTAVFLDYNVPFTIPVAKNMITPPDNFTAYETRDSTIYLVLESIIGDDVDSLYTFLSTQYSSYPDNSFFKTKGLPTMLNQLPSIEKAYPKQWEYAKSYSGDATNIIYFPKLGRVIAGWSRPVLYEVNGDRLNLISNPNDANPPQNRFHIGNVLYSYNADYYCNFRHLIYFGDTNDVANYKNYASLEVMVGASGSSTGTYPTRVSIGPSFDAQGESIASEFKQFFELLFGDWTPDKPDNPYEPGGTSGPGDLPPGTFDETSDPIPDSPLPTLSAANTGFTRIYNPTLAQVQDLARYLWTDETVIQTIWNKIKQYFEDPMQAIIGFNLVPCNVPDAGSQNFALMYIDTGVSMNVAANQFVDVDCGSVKLERYYGSALDQSPYTKVMCFLPYIGTVHLNTDEVMGTELQVKYRIDIVSGSCVAKILVDGNALYQYSGHCAINIPISSSDFSSYVGAAISVAKLGIGLGVAAATGVPLLSGGVEPSQQTNQVVTTTTTETQTVRNPASGRQVTAGTTSRVETVETEKPKSGTKVSYGYLTPSNISNTVGEVMGSKPSIEHSGSFSGNTGYLGVRRPFLIIERPNMCMPEQYQHFNGFPAMITMELSSCKGFTRIQQVQLTGMAATNPEQAEILGLLKSGVYF